MRILDSRYSRLKKRNGIGSCKRRLCVGWELFTMVLLSLRLFLKQKENSNSYKEEKGSRISEQRQMDFAVDGLSMPNSEFPSSHQITGKSNVVFHCL